MSNFMVSPWGKIADKLVTVCGKDIIGSAGVCKKVGFHTLFTPFIQAFTHTPTRISTGVRRRVLPIINTPNNKGDKYLNKLLLIGDCV